MSETQTQAQAENAEPKTDLRTAWADLRKVGKELLDAAIRSGRMLTALKTRYDKAEDFYKAAENQVGWKRSTVNRLIVAARVADESPSLVAKVTSYDSLAAFNKYDAEQRTAIAAEVGSRPDPTTIREVAERLFPPDPETVAERNAREAEDAAKRIAMLVGKHRSAILSAAEKVADEPNTVAMIAGARLATRIGADAPKVIAQVLADLVAENDGDENADENENGGDS